MGKSVTSALAGAFLVSATLTPTAQADPLRNFAPVIIDTAAKLLFCAATKSCGHGSAVPQKQPPTPAAPKPSANQQVNVHVEPQKQDATAYQAGYLPRRPELTEPKPVPPVDHDHALPPDGNENEGTGGTGGREGVGLPNRLAAGLDGELANFDQRVAATGAPPVPRDRLVASLHSVYASAAVARLERLPDEGWTREILQAHILRRAEDLLPEFAAGMMGGGPTAEETVKRLLTSAADATLPDALTEQEAVAFSASLERYQKASVSSAGAPAAVEVPPGVSDLFRQIDAEIGRSDLGLRGKLRARRIVLDCFKQLAPPASAGGNAAQAGGPRACEDRVMLQIANRSKMSPAPAQSVWTQEGPMLNGQKWEMALD